MRGVALYQLGRVDEADATFVAGLGRERERCDLEPLIALTSTLEGVAPADRSPIRRLRAAIADTVQALANGDVQAALAAIDVPVVWRARELNTLAYLADAWLRVVEDQEVDAATVFRARLAFARYLQCWSAEGEAQRVVPWIEGTWEPADVEMLAFRAAKWLLELEERREDRTSAHRAPQVERVEIDLE
jgi:hypothetical protein